MLRLDPENRGHLYTLWADPAGPTVGNFLSLCPWGVPALDPISDLRGLRLGWGVSIAPQEEGEKKGRGPGNRTPCTG